MCLECYQIWPSSASGTRWSRLLFYALIMVFTSSFFREFFPHGATAPGEPGPPHFRGFAITVRHTTPGRTSLDEWSARRRHLYLTTHSTHKRSCPRRVSNPKSQQARGCRPAPYTAWPLGSDITNLLSIIYIISSSSSSSWLDCTIKGRPNRPPLR
jgi:hypothetical protein